MKDHTLEQLLIAARPTSMTPSDFVQTTMQAVKSSQNSEIISGVMRRMDEPQKKGWSFMKKLQTLPLGALVLLALGGALLLGGAGYALYQTFWKPVTVETGQQSVTGDGTQQTELVVRDCAARTSAQDLTVAETPRGTTIAPEEIRKYVIADCEIAAVTKYINDTVGKDSFAAIQVTDLVVATEELLSRDTFRYSNEGALVYAVTDDTLYIKADGMSVPLGEFPRDTLVVPVLTREGIDADTQTPESAKVHAFVELTQDRKYYEQYGESFYTRVACENNVEATCLDPNQVNWVPRYVAGGADVGPDSSRGAAPQIQPDTIVALYEGRITEISGKRVTIFTTDSREIVLDLPFVDDAFTSTESDPYAMAVGDLLQVRAINGDEANVFGVDRVVGINLVLAPISALDSTKSAKF